MTKKDLTALTATGLKALARKKKSAQLKKASAKKQSAKKTAAKKTISPKKTAPKRSAAAKTAKKSAPKKAAAKKAVAKKAGAKKTATKKVSVKAARRAWVVPKSARKPLQTQEKAVDSKYYTGPDVAQSALGSSDRLPAGYGEDRITLMARDPSLTYAYWEATPERLAKERSWFGNEAELVVRIYDVTGVQFDGRNALGYFDQEVSERAGSWYFETGRPGRSLCADLGIRAPEGRFLTLARSNYITMPRDGVSDVIDDEWMLADEEFWQFYGFPEGGSSLQAQEFWRRSHQRESSSPGLFSRAKGKSK